VLTGLLVVLFVEAADQLFEDGAWNGCRAQEAVRCRLAS
jgi:hypothetical protein